VDPKKIEETFKKVGIVIDEIQDRIDSNEYDMLDAKVAKDAVRAKVQEVLAQRELSIEEYKILSGITSAPNGGLKIMGTEFTRQAVKDIFEQVERVRRDSKKVDPLDRSLFRQPWEPLLPLEPLKPLHNEMSLASRAHWMSKGAGLGTGLLASDFERPIPDVAPMSVADSTAVVPNSDPYRVAGKQTIENLLDEAGISYKILIHVSYDDYAAEHLNEDQRALLTEIDKVHPNISCLYELPGQGISMTMVPAKRPNILRRFWDGLTLRFGRAIAGMK
jgi:hypothetical protein